LEKCLTLDEAKRGKAEELMTDKWIKGETGYSKKNIDQTKG
jgi:hypothetical protein